MIESNMIKSKPIIVLAIMMHGLALPSATVAEEETSQYSKEIRPLLTRYCFACHGETKPKGDLNLESLSDPNAFSRPAIWHHIRERVRTREMPPSSKPQPTDAERQRLITFCDSVLARHTLDGHTDPGPLHPRRLNVREHMNVLRDLVIEDGRSRSRRTSYAPRPNGTIFDANRAPEHPCDFVARILPPDTQDGGFDSIGENLSIPSHLLDKYFRCNKRLFDEMFTLNARKPESYQSRLYRELKKLETGPPPRGKTLEQARAEFLAQFASRAFRQPVSVDEIAGHLALFEKSQARGDDFETSIRLSLEAILLSPRFVVLWGDRGADADRDAPPVRPLSDHELAARLSFFLWSALPDRELEQAAREGKLQDTKVLEDQARRMLRDQRVADGLLPGFVLQWLQLDRLDRNAPDAEKYPDYFQNNLSELMKRELMLFADAIVVEDRSILEFIDADWGFVCYPLAKHYGLEDFPGKKTSSNADPSWYRIKFTGKRRGGVLTMGKVLTGTSQPTRTSPVHRGKWVLETILGVPPPPPPPDVDNVLKEAMTDGKDLTVPQLLARHRDNPACFACHQRIDPLGMAFEHFDPVGRWRETDRDQPIDARGALVDGTEFDGIAGLKAMLLSRREEFVRCFVEQMLTYALGRKLEFYDEPTVKEITQAVIADDCKFSRVVVEVAMSYPFRHRRTR
jgi:hypothetical protein